jgi:hypothetical protein
MRINDSGAHFKKRFQHCGGAVIVFKADIGIVGKQIRFYKAPVMFDRKPRVMVRKLVVLLVKIAARHLEIDAVEVVFRFGALSEKVQRRIVLF